MTHRAICFPPRLTPMRAQPPAPSIPFSTAATISILRRGSTTSRAVIMILRSEDLLMRMGKSTMTFLAEIFLPIAVIIR